MQVWSTGMEPRLEVEIWESVVGQYIQELGLYEITHRVCTWEKTLGLQK